MRMTQIPASIAQRLNAYHRRPGLRSAAAMAMTVLITPELYGAVR
jgi:hypothetical protein